jgi:vitamin B12 transporter
MFILLSRASSAIPLLALLITGNAQAQSPQPEGESSPLLVTVTANRTPTSIQRTGSAISIIPGSEIAKSNPGSLVDTLRTVPGLDISETGGPGATAAIRIRGANSGQTLVLIDGVRVNDPGGSSGEFDPAVIAPGLIDRIEVLRGPQSALYGSDAVGGVINIITKKGRGKPVYSIGVEGGSFGTISTVASVAGSNGPWSYAFSGVGQGSEGFSRFGHRIGRLAGSNNINGVAGGQLEKDGYQRFGGFGRIGYDPGNGFRFDVGVISVDTQQKYDASFGAFPDTPSFAQRRFSQVSAKAELDTFDGALTHSLQLFANRTDRSFRDVSFSRVRGNLRQTRTLTDFIGDRVGAEYQATLRLKQFGSIIAGAKIERETADSFGTNLLPVPAARQRTLAAEQDTASAFALWQLPLSERFNVSFGGRHDRVSDAGGFTTGRATAAYRIIETGTKLRTSFGTGAKAATLFQKFSPQFGTASLNPERSVGYDAGIDQDILNGRVTLSLTAFSNRIRNLINFETGPRCLPSQVVSGCFVNVARATTSGLEFSGKAGIIDGLLSATGTYTYLRAKDRATNQTLARRPQHLGRAALQITPTEKWLIEPSVLLVSERFSSANERNRVAPYARFDVYSEYRLNETWKVHGRIENITDTRYQEVFNFGTTGRAFYAGVNATW